MADTNDSAELFKLENLVELNTSFGSAGIDKCNKKKRRILVILAEDEDGNLTSWSAIDPKVLPDLYTEAAESCNTTASVKHTFVTKGENLNG